MTTAAEPSRRWSARDALILGAVACVVLIGGFGIWSVTARIEGAVVAPGTVEIDARRQVVQHPDGGAVADILVREGDTVAAGQVLARLDPDELLSALTIIELQILELRARRARLEAERDGLAELRFSEDLLDAAIRQPGIDEFLASNLDHFAQRRENHLASIERLRRRKAQIGTQIEGLGAQRGATVLQAALIAEEIEIQQALATRGLARRAPVLAMEREAARLEGVLGEIQAAIGHNEERAAEIEHEIAAARAQRREEALAQVSEQEGRELELTERRRAIRARLGRLDIRAPLAGVVHALEITGPGAVIRPAQPVLQIVPENALLVVAARVDPVDVDKVHAGQPVSLRFPAFDARHGRAVSGEVVAVSPDAFTDDRTGRDFYRARIILPEAEVARLPGNASLRPGMPVDAYLQTGMRSPLAYLTSPVTAYFRKALREH
ncbi:HlyD family type I secretion periplasmic adaptor subunit [Maritimibacter sp. HL-12]|uniref:HlyD family type I secretion periplasmic adaptor subunit n=1 Tax=Maritimibacter sp. HL-12 TaxID=1162418 RepID=UPI000A0F0C7C|nr:HlyD family type I secretion periplasmic adaptor subunit [Maritimibacter sp. HL-12]SMH40969.1 HlyD family secretion protein [Maritimibacter sp. HL-12]